MEYKSVKELTEAHSDMDETALDRCNQASRQLADAGIELGGYRLEPALGGKILAHPILVTTFNRQNPRQES